MVDIRLFVKGYLDGGITLTKFKNNYPGHDRAKYVIVKQLMNVCAKILKEVGLLFLLKNTLINWARPLTVFPPPIYLTMMKPIFLTILENQECFSNEALNKIP